MRAVIKSDAAPGCRFVRDRGEPALRPDEVRIEVAAASVCGTDAAFYASGEAGGDLGMTFPRTMGHEVAGTVVEVGSEPGASTVGQRVAVESHLHCGACWFCRHGQGHNCAAMDILGVTVDGAFAERVVVPARSCYPLPDGVDLPTAALLEPAGSAMHGILRSGVDLAGASVLVCGAGPVGLAAVRIAVALGARHVVVSEPGAHRRGMAAASGACSVPPDRSPLEVADAETRARGGFDVALECSGAAAAVTTALDGVRREATVVVVGLVRGDLALAVGDLLITRGLTLRGSWGRSIWRTWETLVGLIDAGRVDLGGMVTHRLPLGALPEALTLMRGDAGKVLLVPSLPDDGSAPGAIATA